MAWCLIPKLADDFKKRLVSGEIEPNKLNQMTSEERHKYFSGIVGEHNAANVNSLFESKLLLKNKELGMINWAKRVTGLKKETRRDLIQKIQNMVGNPENNKYILNPKSEDAFLHDLASARLGTDVTLEEATKITELSNKLVEAKGKLNPDGYTFKTLDSKSEYGASKVLLEKYVSELKLSNKPKMSIFNPKRLFDLAGVSKALRATLDNSYIGRQGIKVLATNPSIWIRDAVKSFKIIGKTLVEKKGAISQTDAVLADVWSREFALNPETKKVYEYLDLGTVEEAYPTSLPEKIPVLGRLFKASEQAYTSTAYLMRADLADFYIPRALEQGVDLTDELEAKGMAKLINSMTGRGSLGKLETISKEINAAFFSIKFLKSNIDTLIAPVKLGYKAVADREAITFADKQAAKNLLKIVGGAASVLVIADRLHPGSVEWDSRSSDFGKIKIGNTRFDVSGGMASIITLASRIATQSTKSTSTGKISKLGSKFGQTTGTDVLMDFLTGKLSPAAAVAKQWGIDRAGYMGKPLSFGQSLSDLFVPMPITTFQELSTVKDAAPLWSIIMDGLGISTNTYAPAQTDWNQSTGKELSQFKDKIGQDKFNAANKEYNDLIDTKLKSLTADDRYKKMSPEDQSKIVTKAKDLIKSTVFKKYNFTYKADKTDKGKLKDINDIAK